MWAAWPCCDSPAMLQRLAPVNRAAEAWSSGGAKIPVYSRERVTLAAAPAQVAKAASESRREAVSSFEVRHERGEGQQQLRVGAEGEL